MAVHQSCLTVFWMSKLIRNYSRQNVWIAMFTNIIVIPIFSELNLRNAFGLKPCRENCKNRGTIIPKDQTGNPKNLSNSLESPGLKLGRPWSHESLETTKPSHYFQNLKNCRKWGFLLINNKYKVTPIIVRL